MADISAFSRAAMDYFDRDLCVTPTGGDDGKAPLLKGYPKMRIGPDKIIEFGRRFPDANVALVCGLSKLNVVDLDNFPTDNDVTSAMLRFGDTPVITRTGGGGLQLFYKGSPTVRPHDFRHSENRAMEIKADGNIVIVPPSRNFKTGKQYHFVAGSIDDMNRLPAINTTSLTQVDIPLRARGTRIAEDRRLIIQVGDRNDWLFSQCLRVAHACDSLDALIDVARTRADEYFGEPMRDAEVVKTARSAWGYEQRGENWAGQKARLAITLDQLHALEALENSDAALLALHLQIEHGGRMARGETFALDTVAMEQAGTIAGWSRSRFVRARDELLAAGILVLRFQGWGRGSPSQYEIAFPGKCSRVNTM